MSPGAHLAGGQLCWHQAAPAASFLQRLLMLRTHPLLTLCSLPHCLQPLQQALSSVPEFCYQSRPVISSLCTIEHHLSALGTWDSSSSPPPQSQTSARALSFNWKKLLDGL